MSETEHRVTRCALSIRELIDYPHPPNGSIFRNAAPPLAGLLFFGTSLTTRLSSLVFQGRLISSLDIVPDAASGGAASSFLKAETSGSIDRR